MKTRSLSLWLKEETGAGRVDWTVLAPAIAERG
jgi:Flp pilus assembly pilin Flp